MRGAAIYLDSSRDVSIRYNTFKNNTAEQGGAIFILHSDVVLKGNNITDNQALTNGDPRRVTQQHEGAGGAVFFGCIDDDADPDSFYRPLPLFDKNGNHIDSLSYSKLSCKLDAASNNFERNFAEAKAGAIMWTTVNFTESLPNNYVNNTSPNG
jgi:Right handed beta helix region